MSASFKVDLSSLKLFFEGLSNPALQQKLESIAQERDIAALVGQAINDNFEKEGPGWEPLKAASLRAKLTKKVRKSLAGLSDEELLKLEAKTRKENENGLSRKILQKSQLLKRTVTIPGYTGSSGGKKKACRDRTFTRSKGTTSFGVRTWFMRVSTKKGTPKRTSPLARTWSSAPIGSVRSKSTSSTKLSRSFRNTSKVQGGNNGNQTLQA